MEKVLILGIDNLSKKNITQLNCLNKSKREVYIFTNDSLKNSHSNLNSKENKLIILEKTFILRIKQIYNFLKKNKQSICHAEVYPGGRFSPIYILLCKMFKIRIIAVERGDLLYWKEYSKFYKYLLTIVYRYSDLVWFRELYMKKQLEDIGVKNLCFIHNCVPNKKDIMLEDKNINFLWVNRFIKERKVKWFVDSIKILKPENNVMLGVMNNKNNDNETYALINENKNLKILKFQNPLSYFVKAKFFVLPSDIVFANNSLLEAMSFGVVPLISNVEGSKLIVDDGIDGFIFEHTKDGLKNAMEKALKLSEEEYIIMSDNAIKKVKENFSYEIWCEKYLNMIEELKNV